jgi:hypothetical protein
MTSMSIVRALAKGPDLPLAFGPPGRDGEMAEWSKAHPNGIGHSVFHGETRAPLGRSWTAGRTKDGEMAEWSKAHAWKVCRRVTVSRVRIPLSPPLVIRTNLILLHKVELFPTWP